MKEAASCLDRPGGGGSWHQLTGLLPASAPTILTDVDAESWVMQEVIFGPIMPIMCMHSLEEAIQFISQ